ncbi:hypothetical protein DsansV1_C26g0191041 [Dioscorea sansibarensis]
MIYGEVYSVINDVNLGMESVERVFEDVFNVIEERELRKEKMVVMERELVRYEEAMDKVVGVVEEREEKEVVERSDEFQVDDEGFGRRRRRVGY